MIWKSFLFFVLCCHKAGAIKRIGIALDVLTSALAASEKCVLCRLQQQLVNRWITAVISLSTVCNDRINCWLASLIIADGI